MTQEIPNILLFAAILIPLTLYVLGIVRGRRAYQLSEVGVSAFALVLLSVISAAIMSSLPAFAATDFVASWIIGAIFAVLSMINAIRMSRLRRHFKAKQAMSENIKNGEPAVLNRTFPEEVPVSDPVVIRPDPSCCTSRVFLDNGISSGISKVNQASVIMDLLLPVTVNFFQVSIAFTVMQDGIKVVARSSAQSRPWYDFFRAGLGLSTSLIRRNAEKEAAGSVDCIKGDQLCIALPEGKRGDVSSSGECQAAAAVDVERVLVPDEGGDPTKTRVDPTKARLIAKGVATFAGLNTIENIEINANGSATANVPNPAGGSGSVGSVSAGFGLRTTIVVPKAAEVKEDATRPVVFQCVPKVEKEEF